MMIMTMMLMVDLVTMIMKVAVMTHHLVVTRESTSVLGPIIVLGHVRGVI